jgi:hypothetical protein
LCRAVLANERTRFRGRETLQSCAGVCWRRCAGAAGTRVGFDRFVETWRPVYLICDYLEDVARSSYTAAPRAGTQRRVTWPTARGPLGSTEHVGLCALSTGLEA